MPLPARPARYLGLALLLGAAGLAAAGLTAYLVSDDDRPDPVPASASPPDPRLEYAGPFRNVHPSVKYVPDERCAECHADIAASFARHPMGRSLLPTAVSDVPPTGADTNNPFEAHGSVLRVVRDGDRLWHSRSRHGPDGKPAVEAKSEVHYTLGSGTRGYSYLTDRDGYLYETPVSWYSQRKRWDLSPGYGPPQLNGRAIGAECLFCHADRANPVPGTVNRYENPPFAGHAIGCQRCHGPGELHLAGPGAGKGADGVDPTIVNPKHLERSLREAVCEQCHLQGQIRVLCRGRDVYDFRPGLPLESFLATFVGVEDAGRGQQAVGHVEQMYQSRCFQATAGPGGLGCVSCHDPHATVPPERRVAHYRDRCMQCHDRRGCSLPQPERLKRSAADSCVECHMPRYGSNDIPHTSITDHRILRTGKPPPPKADRPPGDSLPIVSFYRGRKGVDEEADERSRAMALVELAYAGKVDKSVSLLHAVPMLERALRRNPGDLPAVLSSGLAYAARNRWAEAMGAFEAVLAGSPGNEKALLGAASAAEALGRSDVALEYWRRTVAANPTIPEYRRDLVRLLLRRGAHGEALPESEAWVRTDPFSAEARVARVECLLAAGRKDDARAEFARVEALAPSNLHELRIRYGKRLR